MKLYACPGTCSLAPHILLNEFEAPHELIWLDLRKEESHTPEFLAINPMAQVPTLVTEGGEVITEVAAISLYLFERFRGRPEPLHQAVRQLSFIATELHKSFFPILFGEPMVGAEAAGRLAEFHKAKLRRCWSYVDRLLPEDDDLDGREMGPADPYLYTVCRWWRWIGESFEDCPFIEAFLGHMEVRPSVRKTLELEGLKPLSAAGQALS